jgi:hypothetical protein
VTFQHSSIGAAAPFCGFLGLLSQLFLVACARSTFARLQAKTAEKQKADGICI